ncbi:acetyl-CoA synthetase-like protein [Cylindrobasidium torrendii FP15055 ss-10]|uniref:Acetyl-CoA synthetase-like protein n=1 Tax=Cylindrobasidium torrendii FP15055 ss-10 TaxID=1314674 RepID=A0A0D7BUF6_9AGAR|nr:acetyl-CoA synthetase-like protein [Cylindrobasidium torrendii FP15055 ss-10]
MTTVAAGILESPWPSPPPPPDINAYHAFFSRPDQKQPPWDKDYTLYIDLNTGRRLTFRAFIGEVDRLRKALVYAGFVRGEVVGLMSENCIDFALLLHAFISLNIPVALIAPYSKPLELAHCLKVTGVKKVFAGPRQLGFDWPKHVQRYAMNGRLDGVTSITDLLDAAKDAPAVDVVPASRDDIAYLVFSSGTSGLPKAIAISHANVVYSLGQVVVMAQAAAAVEPPVVYDTPEGLPIFLAFLPIHHTFGLHMYCFRSFLAPQTFVFQAKWSLAASLRAITTHRVTHISFVPSVIAQLVTHSRPDEIKRALKDVKQMSAGAAYLPADLAKRFMRLASGARLSEGYGMSEATIAAITQPVPGCLGGWKPIPGSCGVLLPGMSARLVGEDGQPVRTGEVGELYLRSWNVSRGYFGTTPEVEKANRETFVDGWLRTGDKFYTDDAGNFFFADRAKDTLKVSGIQVSPLELENVLLAHPERLVSDVAVAGVSGGRTQDERVPRAWVVLSPDGRRLLEKGDNAKVVKTLLKWAEAQLSKYKWLRGGIEIVDEIPKNPTGKTLRRELVERYENSRTLETRQAKL